MIDKLRLQYIPGGVQMAGCHPLHLAERGRTPRSLSDLESLNDSGKDVFN